MDAKNLDNSVFEEDKEIHAKKVHKKKSMKASRKMSVKVKRKKSIVKRKVSIKKTSTNVSRTKSFIVKRKSFKRPRRWSTYIREGEISKQCLSGTLPRIKGIWEKRRYKDLTLTKCQGRSLNKNKNISTR